MNIGVRMSTVTEVREFRPPSCRVDKGLINSIGAVLESDNVCRKEQILYALESSSRKITSLNSGQFTDATWPHEIRNIRIDVGEAYPRPVSIMIDFRYAALSKVVVMSEERAR